MFKSSHGFRVTPLLFPVARRVRENDTFDEVVSFNSLTICLGNRGSSVPDRFVGLGGGGRLDVVVSHQLLQSCI